METMCLSRGISESLHPEVPAGGFALLRRRNGLEEVVNTWVGFEGQSHQKGERRASTNWPIQKYQWTVHGQPRRQGAVSRPSDGRS